MVADSIAASLVVSDKDSRKIADGVPTTTAESWTGTSPVISPSRSALTLKTISAVFWKTSAP